MPHPLPEDATLPSWRCHTWQLEKHLQAPFQVWPPTQSPWNTHLILKSHSGYSYFDGNLLTERSKRQDSHHFHTAHSCGHSWASEMGVSCYLWTKGAEIPRLEIALTELHERDLLLGAELIISHVYFTQPSPGLEGDPYTHFTEEKAFSFHWVTTLHSIVPPISSFIC